MSYLEIKNLKVLHHTFEAVKTVLDIDHIAIEKGTTYGIVGESGAGKTVLALTMLKLLQTPPGEIAGGEILFDGEDLLKKDQRYMERTIRGSKVAMIFQDPMSSLNPVFTVGYQMIQVLKKKNKYGDKQAKSEAVEILKTVKLADPENTLEKYPHQLSGGQRQRVIIALALACGAELLIADEPTRNLDVTIQASILKLLKELQEKFRMTVLFIANNLSLVSAFCDNLGILYEGRLVEQGKTAEVLSSPQDDYTKLLIETVKGEDNARKDVVSDEDILKVEHLKKYFEIKKDFGKDKNATLKAVDDVSFTIKKGEVLGIVGESGCGKSTLVNTILKLYEPTDGKVYFKGKDIYSIDKKEVQELQKSIQIVFQDPYWSLNPRWLVKDIIAEPIDVHENLSAKQKLEKVNALLEMVGLAPETAFQYPHEFSGGERQRIAIARSLASEPSLVVLDEPTSSIDVFSQAQILELINNLKEKFHLTNILISHDLGVVSQLSNKIIVMYLGKIVEYGDAREVFEQPRHPYTQALFHSIPKLEEGGIDSLNTLEGNIPSPINPPSGCRFHTRCKHAMPACKEQEPTVTHLSENHYVTCLMIAQAEEAEHAEK